MLVPLIPLPLIALAFCFGACVLPGCGPQKSRDGAGARVEMNPPKTEQFVTKVDAIQPGTPMHTVREQLGNADEFRRGYVDTRPEPGPAETLITLAPAGTRYEHWIYKRGDSHYHVFFTRGARGGDVDWEVLTVRSSRKDEVY